MWSQDLESIYLEWVSRYREEVKHFRSEQLRGLIQNASTKAKKNYQKLVEPKVFSIDTYIREWVIGTVRTDFDYRTLKRITLKNKNPYIQAIASFNSCLPFRSILHLRNKLYYAKPDKRRKIWDNIDLPIEAIEKRFTSMVTEQNGISRKRGYSSFIHFSLNRDKIPLSSYQWFINNVDNIIEHCNQQLPKYGNLPSWFYSEFNNPCYMCIRSSFPFESLDDVFNLVSQKYKILGKFRNKVSIEFDNIYDSRVSYIRETDSFKITINRDLNLRHRAIDLIHELAHIICYLQNSEKNIVPSEKGAYLNEKEASEVEFASLKQISPSLYKTLFAEILLLFRRVLFEIEVHKNPSQNLGKLYAATFNRCFKAPKQKSNSLYILDERIVMKPLSSLPHAIACSELILRPKEKGNSS